MMPHNEVGSREDLAKYKIEMAKHTLKSAVALRDIQDQKNTAAKKQNHKIAESDETVYNKKEDEICKDRQILSFFNCIIIPSQEKLMLQMKNLVHGGLV